MSELFRLSWDVQYVDVLMNPKTGVKRVQGVSPATFGSQIHFGAPAVSHYQNLPVNNETRQWDSRQAANTAHGSVLCCCSWWDNGALILYIQVNVLLSVLFFFYEPNWISAQLSARFKSTGHRQQNPNLRHTANGQTHRHIKSPSAVMRRLHSI